MLMMTTINNVADDEKPDFENQSNHKLQNCMNSEFKFYAVSSVSNAKCLEFAASRTPAGTVY